MQQSPLFIVFEGLDGSGSTTQAKILCERFQNMNLKVQHTSEPTENKIGKLVREILQNQWKTSPEALQLLFCADRGEHLFGEIEPQLEQGISVISDRYYLSTLAFGKVNLDIDWLKGLNQTFRKPDLTFLLDVNVEECLRRIESRGEEKELFEKKEYLEKVWENYLELANEENNTFIIGGERPKETVAEEIWQIVKNRIES